MSDRALVSFLQLVVWHFLAGYLAFKAVPKRTLLIVAVLAFACMNLANYLKVKNIFFSWAIFGAVLLAFIMAIFSEVYQRYQSARGIAERTMTRNAGRNLTRPTAMN